jgi:hypothetical protein
MSTQGTELKDDEGDPHPRASRQPPRNKVREALLTLVVALKILGEVLRIVFVVRYHQAPATQWVTGAITEVIEAVSHLLDR